MLDPIVRKHLEKSSQIAVFVGAGVSVGSGIPTWTDLNKNLITMLVTRLVDELAIHGKPTKPSPELDVARGLLKADPAGFRNFGDWVASRFSGPDDELGQLASSLAERLAYLRGRRLKSQPNGTEILVQTLQDAVLPPGRPTPIPSPLAQAVARAVAGNDRIGLCVTTNFEDLLEAALTALSQGLPSKPPSWATARLNSDQLRECKEVTGVGPVVHLHGLVPTDKGKPAVGPFVLCNADFLEMAAPGGRSLPWQEVVVRTCFEQATCLFVGMSLSDQNMVRWLYMYYRSVLKGAERRGRRQSTVGSGSPRRIALVAREGIPGREDHREALRAYEALRSNRWLQWGVQTVYVDRFSDLITAMDELVTV